MIPQKPIIKKVVGYLFFFTLDKDQEKNKA